MTITPFPAVIDRSNPQANNLDVLLALNEPSGQIAYDASEKKNNGTIINNPNKEVGNFGWGLSLNGSGQYINLPSGFMFTSGQAVTITGWLYSTESSNTYRNFIDSGTGMTGPMIWWDPTGKIEFDGGISAVRTSSVYRNQWVFIALSKPYGLTKATYYVNGVNIGTGSAYNTTNINPKLFNRNTTSTWKGMANDIRIYNKDLSQKEIMEIYINPLRIYKKHGILCGNKSLSNIPYHLLFNRAA